MTALHADACFHPAAAGCSSTDLFLPADAMSTRITEADWVVPCSDDSLAACPSSLLLKKRILCSALVFLLMFYHGVPCGHVHHGTDSGPALLFWLLVLVIWATAPKFKASTYTHAWLCLSLLKTCYYGIKWASETKYLLSKNKQTNKNYSVSRF